jgi:hypothetical protein
MESIGALRAWRRLSGVGIHTHSLEGTQFNVAERVHLASEAIRRSEAIGWFEVTLVQ